VRRRRVAGHLIASRRLEIAAGVGAFVLGAILLHDAFEKRGQPQPLLLRPFTWW
jgi:hypothetical protein